MKFNRKIISSILAVIILASMCVFSAATVVNDKKFTVEDATLVQKNVVGMAEFDYEQIKLYDLNNDGVITVVDSTDIQKIIVGLLSEPTEPNTEQPTTTPEPVTEEPSQSQDVPSTFKACSIKTAHFGTLKYWLYTPSNPTENMPLIVYLHGGSGKGDDLNLITFVDGFPQYLQTNQLGDVRAYVVIPQLPSSQKGWSDIAEAISYLIDSTVSTYKINSDNISLTGHSMGGTGTWNLACTCPKLFARIAPLSGSIRNTTDNISKLKNIPVRAFVGSADTIVSPNFSKEVVAALKAEGDDAEITVFDGADHFSVPSLTYLDQSINLVGWLIGN